MEASKRGGPQGRRAGPRGSPLEGAGRAPCPRRASRWTRVWCGAGARPGDGVAGPDGAGAATFDARRPRDAPGTMGARVERCGRRGCACPCSAGGFWPAPRLRAGCRRRGGGTVGRWGAPALGPAVAPGCADHRHCQERTTTPRRRPPIRRRSWDAAPGARRLRRSVIRCGAAPACGEFHRMRQRRSSAPGRVRRRGAPRSPRSRTLRRMVGGRPGSQPHGPRPAPPRSGRVPRGDRPSHEGAARRSHLLGWPHRLLRFADRPFPRVCRPFVASGRESVSLAQ